MKRLNKLGVLLMVGLLMSVTLSGDTINFYDDFENGSGKWEFTTPFKIAIKDSGDPAHGKVLAMSTGGPMVYALVKGSDDWTNVRIEGDLCFPQGFSHYLGIIYNYREIKDRADFGSVFVYGRYLDPTNPWTQGKTEVPPKMDFIGDIILPNPHRDSNACRLLYPEYKVELKGDDTVKPGHWYRFKLETIGNECHFYLHDMKNPKLTFAHHEFDSGKVGFKPRYGGYPTWVDNVRITSIDKFAYQGPVVPAGIVYHRDKMINRWHALGPVCEQLTAVEEGGYDPKATYTNYGRVHKWQDLDTDDRGCLHPGRVIDRFSGNWYGYFHTEIVSDQDKDVTLEFSSANRLTPWLNGEPLAVVSPSKRIWHDYLVNPEHKGTTVKARLKKGKNQLLMLVRGGRYGGDGFYTALRDAPEPGKK